jgi:hypothetical protein
MWCLVSYEIYIKIGRHALLCEIWVDFPYLIRVIDSFGENVRRVDVGCGFSFGAIELRSHGCALPPSLGAEEHEVGARS